MLVPLGHAQGDALVELVFAEADGRGIHGVDQLVLAAVFLVEQRGRLGGIEAEGRAHGVLPLGEVIHLLGNVGQEYLEPVGQRGVRGAVFLERLAHLVHNLLRFFLVARLGIAQSTHVHVRVHVLVVLMMVPVAHDFRSRGQVALGRWLVLRLLRTEQGAARRDDSLNVEQMQQKIKEIHAEQRRQLLAILSPQQQESLKTWWEEQRRKQQEKKSDAAAPGASEDKPGASDDDFFAGMVQDDDPAAGPAQARNQKKPAPPQN